MDINQQAVPTNPILLRRGMAAMPPLFIGANLPNNNNQIREVLLEPRLMIVPNQEAFNIFLGAIAEVANQKNAQ